MFRSLEPLNFNLLFLSIFFVITGIFSYENGTPKIIPQLTPQIVSNSASLDCLSAHTNGYRRVRMPKSSRIINHNYSPEGALNDVPMHFIDPVTTVYDSDSQILNSEFTIPETTTIDEEIRFDPETSVFYRVRKIRRRKKKKSKNRHNIQKIQLTNDRINEEKKTAEPLDGGPVINVDNENKVHFIPEDHFITIEDLQKRNQHYSSGGIVETMYEGITPIPQSIYPTESTTVSPIIAGLLSKINDIKHITQTTPIPSTITEYSSNYAQFINNTTESQKLFYKANVTGWIKERNFAASNRRNSSTENVSNILRNITSLSESSSSTTTTTTEASITSITISSGTPIVYFTSARPVQTVTVAAQLAKVIAPSVSLLSSNRYLTNGINLTTNQSSTSAAIGIDSARASFAVIAFCVSLLVLTALILLVMHRETVWSRVWSLRTVFDPPSSSVQSARTGTVSSTVTDQQQSSVIGTANSLRNSRRDPDARQQVPTFASISTNRIVDGVITEDNGELIGQIITRPTDHSYYESTQRSKQYLSRVQRWVPKRPPLPGDLLEKKRNSLHNSQYHTEQHANSTFPRDYRAEC